MESTRESVVGFAVVQVQLIEEYITGKDFLAAVDIFAKGFAAVAKGWGCRG